MRTTAVALWARPKACIAPPCPPLSLMLLLCLLLTGWVAACREDADLASGIPRVQRLDLGARAHWRGGYRGPHAELAVVVATVCT